MSLQFWLNKYPAFLLKCKISVNANMKPTPTVMDVTISAVIALLSLDCRTVLTPTYCKRTWPDKQFLHFCFILRNKHFTKSLMRDTHRTQYRQFLSDVPNEVLLNVFPFKVVFHVQTAMHASLNIAPPFKKKKRIKKIQLRNPCYICCLSASLSFGLFFMM